MRGFHTWWGGTREPFLLVTQIASAAAWRRIYEPLELFTDEEGLSLLQEYDLWQLYTKPECVERSAALEKVCWAWPKIAAMRAFGRGVDAVTSVDTDCVVWEPLQINPEISLYGLHYDRGDWPVYHELRPLMQMLEPDWNWDVQPVNAGLLLMRDPETREQYFRAARKAASFLVGTVHRSPDALSMTVEQLLPVAQTLHAGQRVDVFETISDRKQWRHDPTRVTHLWGSKRIYRENAHARAALMQHLIERVERFDARSAAVMRRIADLDQATKQHKEKTNERT